MFSGLNTNTNTVRFQKFGWIRIRILFGFRNLAKYEYYSGSEIGVNTNTNFTIRSQQFESYTNTELFVHLWLEQGDRPPLPKVIFTLRIWSMLTKWPKDQMEVYHLSRPLYLSLQATDWKLGDGLEQGDMPSLPKVIFTLRISMLTHLKHKTITWGISLEGGSHSLSASNWPEIGR